MEDFKNQHRVGGVNQKPLQSYDNSSSSFSGNLTRGGNALMQNPGHDITIGAASSTAEIPSTHSTGLSQGTSPGDVPSGTGIGVGTKIRGMAAQAHGLGEAFRGNIGAAVDTMAGDKEGQVKNEEVARRGRYEINENQFAPKGN